ncbi:serine/threonine-protein kinase [Nonomuraea recticatena]|uniref:serine/threonine-protein kinase n=1 Tax=Nonomuraea recticatena TaxID=46178 RepID=UPI00361B0162
MGDALIDGDPQRLGGYWLAGRVGEGGQGVVYEGYDAEGQRVAIKVFRGDPSVQPRLAKEAAAARRVPAFCTARVLDADLEGPRPYIVSEYVEGPSLRQVAKVFRGDELHRLATAMATALTAIHDAGVVHRDLKPDNVLLGPDGPRVIDFGVARTMEMSLTSAGLVAGTPSYMAPEVFSGSGRACPPMCSPGAPPCCSPPRGRTRSGPTRWARSCTACCPTSPTCRRCPARSRSWWPPRSPRTRGSGPPRGSCCSRWSAATVSTPPGCWPRARVRPPRWRPASASRPATPHSALSPRTPTPRSALPSASWCPSCSCVW